jgi:hypothetical protein
VRKAATQHIPYLIKELTVFHVLTALLQFRERLQELHWGGNLGQLALVHKVLDQAPDVHVRGRRLLRGRQCCPPWPSWLILGRLELGQEAIEMPHVKVLQA